MSSSRVNSCANHDHQRDNRDAADDMRPYACQLPGCTRRFKRRFTLKEHVKTHSGEKAFTCPVPSCHKSFTTAGNLSRHKRLHPWLETTFDCFIVGCGCTFPSENKLERHMSMVHFGQSAHLCPHASCGGAFSTAGNLRRHLRQYHVSYDGSRSPTMSIAFVEAKKPAAVQQLQRSMNSPVAVDSFTDANTNHHGKMPCWATPPSLEITLQDPAPLQFLNDEDLFDAIGFLFEPTPHSFSSPIA